jgi:hypothetical protein
MRKSGFSLKAVLVTSVIGLSLAFYVHLPVQFFDFRAFYCAGQAELSGADPYREHPLHECEQGLSAPTLAPLRGDVTVPAPFPGFVLAVFAALATLPFPCALAVWLAGSLVALGCAIVFVAQTTSTSMTANVIALGFPAAIVALPLGQVTPFVLLAVAGSAVMLQRGRPRLAALTALGAMLDPHVGVAVLLGIFAGVPRARVVLIGGTAALFVLGLCVSGPSREWEYVRSVIPAHALANVTDGTQFSTTNLVYLAGVSPAAALRLGSLWYGLATAAGVVVALRLRKRLGIVAVAYIPLAFAVFGGPHSHLQQLAMAIPAFMLLSSAATGGRREFCSVVTFVAAVPWLYITPFSWLYIAPSALALVFAAEMKSARQGARLAAACFVTLTVTKMSMPRSAVPVQFHAITAGNPLAEVSWQTFMTALNGPMETWYLIARAPTVVAFVILLALLANASRPRLTLVREC